jgi:hypothetical protein
LGKKKAARRQLFKFGRSQANVFEPSHLVVRRIYRVQWKKPIINQDELAKLYWDDGLTMEEIAKIYAVGRTTVRDRLCKLKVIREKGRINGFSR